ncbi:MAG: hypothetical protein E7374_00425 [Clostridiales bacterium]|nr:hypothetical protein [Clostridiales bacterium]
MNAQAKKVKLIIIGAISLIALLLFTCIFQLIGIARKKEKIERQEKEIEKLEKELEFYSNLENDSKSPDIEIEIEGEE